jgi:hypothetical protein
MMVRLATGATLGALAAALVALAGSALADLAVTANDSHSANVDGVMGRAKNPLPDTVSIIGVGQYPPKVVATVEAPTSVVGAPTSIWIVPDVGSGAAAIRTPWP